MVNVNNNTNPTHAFVELDAIIMPLCSTCGAYFSILKHDFMVPLPPVIIRDGFVTAGNFI